MPPWRVDWALEELGPHGRAVIELVYWSERS
jgi:hypothetical protein